MMPLFLLPGQIDISLATAAVSFLVTIGTTICGVLWRRVLFLEERNYKERAEMLNALNKSIEAQNNVANAVARLTDSVALMREEIIRGNK